MYSMRGIFIFFLALLLFGCDNTELPKEVAEAYASLPEEIDYNVHVKNSDTLKRVDFSLLSADDIVKLIVDL